MLLSFLSLNALYSVFVKNKPPLLTFSSVKNSQTWPEMRALSKDTYDDDDDLSLLLITDRQMLAKT